MNILQTSYSNCRFPSLSPTLHFSLKLFPVPLGKSTDWHFPLKQKTQKCCKGKDEVHSHADHITPLCSGSSGIRSSQLKLRNQEPNDCLDKVFKAQSTANRDHWNLGWLITHLKLQQCLKTLLLTSNYFFSSYSGFTVKTLFQPCCNKLKRL